MRLAKVAIFDLAAASAGVALGVWTSLMAYLHPLCGPHEFCLILLMHRFAPWQSALIGGATMAVVLLVGGAVNSDMRRVNLGAARLVPRWLFRHPPRITRVGRPGAGAA